MGFDKSFLPVNLVLIGVSIYIWYPLVSIWIIIPIALVLAVLSIDPIGGQFLCVFIVIILMGIGMGLREKRGDESNSEPESEKTITSPSDAQGGLTPDHSNVPGVFIK